MQVFRTVDEVKAGQLQGEDAQQAAFVALKTGDLEFPRWCA